VPVPVPVPVPMPVPVPVPVQMLPPISIHNKSVCNFTSIASNLVLLGKTCLANFVKTKARGLISYLSK
jgi:hypothetical protein